MHELALAQGVIDIVEAQARAQAFARVKKVRLSLGALAQVEPDALAFGFSSVSRGTVAQGAELVIERPEGQAFCLDCGAQVKLLQRGECCPLCSRFQLIVTGGEDMRVIDLEVD